MSTKWDVIEQVARNLGDFRFEGVVSEATNLGTYARITLNDITLANSEDLEDGWAFLNSISYKIAVYDPEDKKAYLLPTFATVPATGATIALFKDFSKDDYDKVFESVFGRLAGRVLQDDLASAAVSTLIDYTLPTTWKYIHAIEMYGTDSQWPATVAGDKWAVRNASLRLNFTLASTGTIATISFLGQKHPAVPTTDAGEVDVFGGLFRDCLAHRMEEHLGLRKLRSVIQSQSVSGTSVATTFGTITQLATMTEVATTTGIATTTGTTAVLDHVTGQEERVNSNELRTDTELRSGIQQSSESTDSYTANTENQATKLSEEDWINFVVAAREAADALEMYLYERPHVNSRRIR